MGSKVIHYPPPVPESFTMTLVATRRHAPVAFCHPSSADLYPTPGVNPTANFTHDQSCLLFFFLLFEDFSSGVSIPVSAVSLGLIDC